MALEDLGTGLGSLFGSALGGLGQALSDRRRKRGVETGLKALQNELGYSDEQIQQLVNASPEIRSAAISSGLSKSRDREKQEFKNIRQRQEEQTRFDKASELINRLWSRNTQPGDPVSQQKSKGYLWNSPESKESEQHKLDVRELENILGPSFKGIIGKSDANQQTRLSSIANVAKKLGIPLPGMNDNQQQQAQPIIGQQPAAPQEELNEMIPYTTNKEGLREVESYNVPAEGLPVGYVPKEETIGQGLARKGAIAAKGLSEGALTIPNLLGKLAWAGRQPENPDVLDLIIPEGMDPYGPEAEEIKEAVRQGSNTTIENLVEKVDSSVSDMLGGEKYLKPQTFADKVIRRGSSLTGGQFVYGGMPSTPLESAYSIFKNLSSAAAGQYASDKTNGNPFAEVAAETGMQFLIDGIWQSVLNKELKSPRKSTIEPDIEGVDATFKYQKLLPEPTFKDQKLLSAPTPKDQIPTPKDQKLLPAPTPEGASSPIYTKLSPTDVRTIAKKSAEQVRKNLSKQADISTNKLKQFRDAAYDNAEIFGKSIMVPSSLIKDRIKSLENDIINAPESSLKRLQKTEFKDETGDVINKFESKEEIPMNDLIKIKQRFNGLAKQTTEKPLKNAYFSVARLINDAIKARGYAHPDFIQSYNTGEFIHTALSNPKELENILKNAADNIPAEVLKEVAKTNQQSMDLTVDQHQKDIENEFMKVSEQLERSRIAKKQADDAKKAYDAYKKAKLAEEKARLDDLAKKAKEAARKADEKAKEAARKAQESAKEADRKAKEAAKEAARKAQEAARKAQEAAQEAARKAKEEQFDFNVGGSYGKYRMLNALFSSFNPIVRAALIWGSSFLAKNWPVLMKKSPAFRKALVKAFTAAAKDDRTKLEAALKVLNKLSRK